MKNRQENIKEIDGVGTNIEENNEKSNEIF